MGTARVTFPMVVVMITPDIGVEVQFACYQCFCCCISVAGNTTIKPDTHIAQCHLGTAANTAADQGIYAMCNQESSQCAVTASIGIDYFGTYNLAICNVIDLECFCVSKVLKNFSIFISNCNLHNDISFIL